MFLMLSQSIMINKAIKNPKMERVKRVRRSRNNRKNMNLFKTYHQGQDMGKITKVATI